MAIKLENISGMNPLSTEGPVRPEDLVGDEWMNDPVKKAEFDRLMKEGDEQLRPLYDAIRDSERLTERDYAITILPVPVSY
jgi:hypothetical protein